MMPWIRYQMRIVTMILSNSRSITVKKYMEEIHWTLRFCPSICNEQSFVMWRSASHRPPSKCASLFSSSRPKVVYIPLTSVFRCSDIWKRLFKSAWRTSFRESWRVQHEGLGHNRLHLMDLKRFLSRNNR